MLTIARQIHVTMAAHVLTVTAGSCVPVRLVSREQIVKSTSTNVTPHLAAMVQLVKTKSTALNVSALRESLEIVAKVRFA